MVIIGVGASGCKGLLALSGRNHLLVAIESGLEHLVPLATLTAHDALTLVLPVPEQATGDSDLSPGQIRDAFEQLRTPLERVLREGEPFVLIAALGGKVQLEGAIWVSELALKRQIPMIVFVMQPAPNEDDIRQARLDEAGQILRQRSLMYSEIHLGRTRPILRKDLQIGDWLSAVGAIQKNMVTSVEAELLSLR